MQRHTFTGWLIVFMVGVGITGVNGLASLGVAERTWKPHMANCPSLQGAVLVFQLLTGAGILAWLFTAWLLYQREPGTLKKAQMSLLVGSLLRLVGLWSIVLFGGLPTKMAQRLVPQLGYGTSVILLFTGAWYFYLLRSERVREIYAA